MKNINNTRRVYQGLHSLFRTYRNLSNPKCGITCSLSTNFHLHLKPTNHYVLLEMPRLDSTTEFFTEIIRQSKSKQVYSQFFSKSTLSQWLSRYVNNKGRHSEQTVSVEEFDPLKHRSIEQPDTVVRATDCVGHASSLGDNCSAVSVRDVLPLPNHTLHTTTQSWHSLDKNIVGPEGSGEPIKVIKKQMEIAACNIPERFNPGPCRIPEGSKPMSSREKFLRQCLGKREAEFKEKKPFKIFCGSWNANGRNPPDTLDSWLLVDKEPPDIYAIGFQELDNHTSAIFMESAKEVQWQEQMLKCINTQAAYQKVTSIRLVGILLVVYIQEKHLKHVRYVDTDHVPTGYFGVVGDKGGVAVRLTLHNTSLCFINSHLAAHQAEISKRNSDYNEIFTKVKFNQLEPPQGISEQDIMFWFGDLNYRIDLPIDDVKSYIKRRDYKRLMEADQLHNEMKKNGELFEGFQEGTYDFDPTYKFDPGTDTYDTSEKNRIPAWCDRILWRGSGVEQLRFGSHPEQTISDHKPISSLFKVDVPVIREVWYKCVFEEVMTQLDHRETDSSTDKCFKTEVGVINENRFKNVYEEFVKKLLSLEKEYLPQTKLDKRELLSHLPDCPENIFLYSCAFLKRAAQTFRNTLCRQQVSGHNISTKTGPCTSDIQQR